jgi:hypothetical protein
MLGVTALAAVYFAGRVSSNPNFGAPEPGTWQLSMPVGAQRPVRLLPFGPCRFLLQGAGVMDGSYLWKDRRLTMEAPQDNRMVGMAWQWSGDDLVLTAETPGRPTGATYLGARLSFVTTDTSAAGQAQAVTVNGTRRVRPPRASQRTRTAEITIELAELEGFTGDPWQDPAPGQWEIQVRPASNVLRIQLRRLPDDKYELNRAGVFNGVYAVRDKQLVVVSPDDRRMIGLAWAWQENELVLVAEPADRPTGASYLGTRLRPSQTSAQPD